MDRVLVDDADPRRSTALPGELLPATANWGGTRSSTSFEKYGGTASPAKADAHVPRLVWEGLKGSLAFALHKLRYGLASRIRHGTALVVERKSGQTHQLRIVRKGRVLGSLDVFTARDEIGSRRGTVSLNACVHRLFSCQDLSQHDKGLVLAQLVAGLGISASYDVTDSPLLNEHDKLLMRKVLCDAGFAAQDLRTFIYQSRQNGPDTTADIESKSTREQTRSAGRKLDVIEIGLEEFIRFHDANLTQKNNYRRWDIDSAFVVDALARGKARILAVRERAAEGAKAQDLHAAMIYTWDDTSVKLYRISYDTAKTANPHANKVLIARGMQMAHDQGLLLDTDCAPSGAAILYERFGFPERVRTHYTRFTLLAKMAELVRKDYPSLDRRLRPPMMRVVARVSRSMA
ncbi:hypothetical protein [Muricoccus radiodurans]|uniref:hypothetical protein n=1 Tax=Muricoccus radiodurans TaxID=2231721 RepID=UPI003CEEEF0A